MSDLVTLNQNNHAEIEALFLGRRIVAAEMGTTPIPHPPTMSEWDRPPSRAEGVLTLDDGTQIYTLGNDGGCACSAGCYPLAHLATVDNVITSVRFDDRPADDEQYNNCGWYRIYVVADATEINIASFEGTDGNGYYGTGYELFVRRGTAPE